MYKKFIFFAGILLSCLSLTLSVFASTHHTFTVLSDTLVMELGNKSRLVIPVADIQKPVETVSLNTLLKNINRDLDAIKDSLIDPKYPTVIIYAQAAAGGRTLQVKPTGMDRSELYLVKETGAIKSRINQDTVVVEQADGQKLFFIADLISDLKKLEEQDLDALFNGFKNALTTELSSLKKRNFIAPLGPHTAIYPDSEGNRKIKMRYGHSRNTWGISFGTGAGLIRDRLVPELGVGLSLTLSKKHYIGLTGTAHYFFERNSEAKRYNMAINTFVTAEYGIRIYKDIWNTIGVGYLVSRQGDYFSKNTFKFSLGLNRKRNQTFHLIPELYVTDQFKTAFPGLRIGVGF